MKMGKMYHIFSTNKNKGISVRANPHPKYCSLIPISRFCECLDSGRRTELEGTNGMYDLYESELLGNQIVGGLHTVNENLDKVSSQLGTISSQLSSYSADIQRNQALLYEEVAESNRIAKNIGLELKSLAENCDQRMASIENSARMTALNTAVTARRTDALTTLAEYEYAAEHATIPL